MSRSRLVAWFAVAAFLVPVPTLGQSPSGTATPTAGPSVTPGWEDEVRAMLARRAQAVLKGDEKAFLATMDGAPESFRTDRLTWLRRMRALPLGTYRLDFAQDEFAELTRDADRRRHPGEVHLIQVKERIGFRAYDAAPAAEDVFLTVVKRGSGWSVVADDEAESLALQSNRNLWDFGSVAKLESDGIMIDHDR